MGMSG